MPFLKFNISSKEGEKDWVGVDANAGQYDIEKATPVIEDFCVKNHIKVTSFEYGYGEILINDKLYHISPYGIDLKMMLEWCDQDPKNFMLEEQKPRMKLK